MMVFNSTVVTTVACSAAKGVAHAVIPFVAQVLTEEEWGDFVASVLGKIEAVGVGQALDEHAAPANIRCASPTCSCSELSGGGPATRHRLKTHHVISNGIAPPACRQGSGAVICGRPRAFDSVGHRGAGSWMC